MDNDCVGNSEVIRRFLKMKLNLIVVGLDLAVVVMTAFVMIYSLMRGMTVFWWIFNYVFLTVNIFAMMGNLLLLNRSM